MNPPYFTVPSYLLNPRSPCPPSRTPPYHRPIHQPAVDTLSTAGVIDLDVSHTYLIQGTPPTDGSNTFAVVIPNGLYVSQIKHVLLLPVKQYTATQFRVSGQFAEFKTLLFLNVGTSAVLQWDGMLWHFMGGNAQPEVDFSNDNTGGGGNPPVPPDVCNGITQDITAIVFAKNHEDPTLTINQNQIVTDHFVNTLGALVLTSNICNKAAGKKLTLAGTVSFRDSLPYNQMYIRLTDNSNSQQAQFNISGNTVNQPFSIQVNLTDNQVNNFSVTLFIPDTYPLQYMSITSLITIS